MKFSTLYCARIKLFFHQYYKYMHLIDMVYIYFTLDRIEQKNDSLTFILVRTEKIIHKASINCNTWERTRQSNIKYLKFTARLDEEIPRKKVCVNIIFPYRICRKVKKEYLTLKAVTMINTGTWWFEIIQYDNIVTIKIEN